MHDALDRPDDDRAVIALVDGHRTLTRELHPLSEALWNGDLSFTGEMSTKHRRVIRVLTVLLGED